MEHLVKKRIQYFLSSNYRGRGEILRNLLPRLKNFGPVVVFGGLVRDLALFGNRKFCSDLDLVIDTSDLDGFHNYMLSIRAKFNRYLGYRVVIGRWPVDIWPLQNTWAHREGHVEIKEFKDLLDTTFFGCDAILYDISKNKLVSNRGYFEEMSKRLLDINLLPNPNPIGNSVRAFRYAIDKKFIWSYRLSRYIAERIDELGWSALIEHEWKSYKTKYIEELDRHKFEKELSCYLSERNNKPYFEVSCKDIRQLDLPLHLPAGSLEADLRIRKFSNDSQDVDKVAVEAVIC